MRAFAFAFILGAIFGAGGIVAWALAAAASKADHDDDVTYHCNGHHDPHAIGDCGRARR